MESLMEALDWRHDRVHLVSDRAIGLQVVATVSTQDDGHESRPRRASRI